MAKENTEFRKVVMTGERTQVVLMAIPAGAEIGAETRVGHDQVLILVEGTGKAMIDQVETPVGAGDLCFVPSGIHHNFVNEGPVPLKLDTMYRPPEHAPGLVHRTKAEADVNELVKSDRRVPFGGIKRSGYGRELSWHGMREFLNAKTVWIQ